VLRAHSDVREVRNDRSKERIVSSGLDVKSWLEREPTAEEARPGQCPACGQASRPAGRGLWLWGHGLRERQQRGPLEAGGVPQTVVIRARRYRCRGCGALVAVVPRGVLRGRHYSAGAIGLALVLFGVVGLPLAEVRSRVSPWPVVGETAQTTWLAVRRWIRAIRERRLFARVRATPATWSARQIAERAAMTLEALASPTLSGEITARAFAGAVLAS